MATVLALTSPALYAREATGLEAEFGHPILKTEDGGGEHWFIARPAPCLSIAGGRQCVRDPHLAGANENWRLDLEDGKVVHYGPALTPARFSELALNRTRADEVVRALGPAAKVESSPEGGSIYDYTLVNGAIRLPAALSFDRDGVLREIVVNRPAKIHRVRRELGHP